jgi:3-methyladenine DNA glycosylase AlkD
MTAKEIMADLQLHGDEHVKKILLKHGVKEPFFGVKIEHLKTIQKKVKTDYALAKELYATGNADAMYLAGLVADDDRMTKEDLQLWVGQAVSNNINEYTVPWVTAGSRHGFALAMEWMDAVKENIAAAGWATLSNIVALKPDTELNIPQLKQLLERVIKTIHTAPNRVRYTMNGFLTALGCYVIPLSNDAIAAAKKIGIVMVEMNGTACKVPSAVDYIVKVKNRGTLGKKKKMVKC